ncbi:MAG: SDR family oxidoreductase [Rhizobiales bacterium]|nr:SDR family oxidoreductase [Hyphomicrobiales bacterium]
MYLRLSRKGRVSLHRPDRTDEVTIIAERSDDLSDLRRRLEIFGEIEGDFSAVRIDVVRLREIVASDGTGGGRDVASWLDAQAMATVRAPVKLLASPLPRDYPAGRAIVVGGTGAIGSDLVRVLAERQVDVAFTTRKLDHRAAALRDEVSEGPSAVEAHPLDITEDGAAERLFERLNVERDVHSVFFAAGIPVPQRSVSAVSWTEWEQAVNFEVNGFFRVAHAAVRILKANGGGALVAMTTIATLRYPPRDGLSGAPKAAAEMLVRAIAREEGRFGIRANCVAPGLIEGGIGQVIINEFADARVLEGIRAGTPTRRLCTARDCAEAAAFLASSGAASITGHVLPVDGGFHI